MKISINRYMKKYLLPCIGIFSYINRLILLNKTLYVAHHGDFNNLYEIYKHQPGDIYLTKRNRSKTLEIKTDKIWHLYKRFNYISFFLKLIFYKNIVLDDSTNSIHFIKFSPKQKIIQMWHACGAFKRFGIGSLHNSGKKPGRMYKKYSHILVSSHEVAPIYAESFGIECDKISTIGVPRTDYFFNQEQMDLDKKSLLKKYPNLIGKKIVLYSPTYRTKSFFSEEVFNNLRKINSLLGKDYAFVYSLHPFEKNLIYPGFESWQNLSFENNKHLLAAADILVTDYSSIIFEYSLLNRPIVFFAYDLDSYTNEQRDFYYKYEDFVPGAIVSNVEELALKLIEDISYDKIAHFKSKFMGACDGKSSMRLNSLLSGK